MARELAVDTNSFAAYRGLADENTWSKWWPREDSINPGKLPTLNGYQFSIDKKLFKTLEIGLQGKDIKHSSGMLFIPLGQDSSIVRWEVAVETGNNPIQKLQRYSEAKKIANTFAEVLTALKPFLQKEENLYSLSVYQGMVKDTVFVSTRRSFSYFPSTDEVYSLIDKLHSYIAKQQGKETSQPMLNIDSSGKNEYNVMVAIATDRILPEQEDIKLKRMIRGNILIAEVKGGPNKIKESLLQLHEYVRDHKRTSPAIPFQLLITDRSKEKDTSKWVTELHYPVF